MDECEKNLGAPKVYRQLHHLHRLQKHAETIHVTLKGFILQNTCNMGMRDLPDMYAQSLRGTGLRDEGIHFRQIMNAHVTSVM